MTEAEWLACDNVASMLNVLSAGDVLSPRQSRLFMVALCRRIWDLFPMDKHRQAVEVAERYADGRASSEELAVAKKSLRAGRIGKTYGGPQKAAAAASWHAVGGQMYYCPSRVAVEVKMAQRHAALIGPEDMSEQARLASLLREIVGPSPGQSRPAIPDAVLIWNNATIPHLANEAYNVQQMPSGHLELDRLAVLSDALEEAGCTDVAILEHLRSPGPHVRGCWALDCVLNTR